MSTLKKNKTVSFLILIAALFVITLIFSMPIITDSLMKNSAINSQSVEIGSKENPILIDSAEAFAKLRYDASKYYRQTKDIDLSELKNFGGISKFFTGNYDGQRFKIKNVKLNKASESGVGLFGVNKGVIANVIIDSGEIVGASQVGAIAGSNLGEITGCTNFAFVKGNGAGIGGIAGSNNGNINNCANRAKIVNSASGTYTGGIVGSNLAVVTKCYNTANVEGGAYIAGIAGNNDGTNMQAEITECYNVGEISGIAKSAICGDNWQGKVENVVYSNEKGLDAVVFNTGTAHNLISSGLTSMASRGVFSSSFSDFDSNWLFMRGNKYPSLRKEYVELQDVDFTGSPDTVQQGSDYQFKARLMPSNATPVTLNYELVSGAACATMDIENGFVSISNEASIGTDVTIAVKADDKTFTHAFKIVKKAVEKVELSAETNKIFYGESVKLTAKVSPDDATYKEVDYIYNDEFVTIENDVVTLKRGCPAGYEFTIAAEADGVVSNAVTMTVGVISPQYLVFPLGGEISVNPGDVVSLTDYIDVYPYNAQYKFLNVDEKNLSKSLSLHSDMTIYVDMQAKIGRYTVGFDVDGKVMINKFVIMVTAPKTKFDFALNAALLTPDSTQEINLRSFDGVNRDVEFELKNNTEGINLSSNNNDGTQKYYLNIDKNVSASNFTLVAKTSDGIEIEKTYDIIIPVKDIIVDVNNVSSEMCSYVETTADGELVFNITPNGKAEMDRTELLLNINPTNTTFSQIKYVLTEHEEIVQYDQLNDGKLLLKLYPLSTIYREDGSQKQFIIKLFAGDVEKTLIFKVVPVEVKNAVLYEKNGYSLNDMYVGNTYNIVLEPDAFATDIVYSFITDDLNKNYLYYEIHKNVLSVTILANPSQEEIVVLKGVINNVETQINLVIKVAVEEVKVNYVAEHNKFEAGRGIECVVADVYPSTASDKNVKFFVKKGFEYIDPAYLICNEANEWYIKTNENGKAFYKLKTAFESDCTNKEINIVAVAHNGVTSDYCKYNILPTTIDEMDMSYASSSEMPTVLSQFDSKDLKISYSPSYYKGDVQVIFPANRRSWFDFEGKESGRVEGDKFIFTAEAQNGEIYLNDFTFNNQSVIEENIVIILKIDGQEKEYVLDVAHGIVPSAAKQSSDDKTTITFDKVEYLKSIEVTIKYKGKVAGVKTFEFSNGNSTQQIDLAEMLCYITPDSIDIKYQFVVHYDTNVEQGISAKDVHIELDDTIEDFTNSISGAEQDNWDKYKSSVTSAFLNVDKFSKDINIPQNIENITFLGSSEGNDRIVVENRNEDLNMIFDSINYQGTIDIQSTSKTYMIFQGGCNLTSKAGANAINSKGDIEFTNDGSAVNIKAVSSSNSGANGVVAVECVNAIFRNCNKFSVSGSNGKNGSDGSSGGNGNDGSNGENYSGSYWSAACGDNGVNGGSGNNGGTGGNGAVAIHCDTIEIINSNITISGGSGGNGGAGGNGGNGGKGGNGADTYHHKDKSDAGNGGTGGRGGNGGQGGSGGAGASAVSANSVLVQNSEVKFINGNGGSAGAGGNGGNGGKGGKGGADTQPIGQEGYGGNGGNGGNAGKYGSAGSGANIVVINSQEGSQITNSAGSNGERQYSEGIRGKGGAGGSRGDTGGNDDGTVTNGSAGSDGSGRYN